MGALLVDVSLPASAALQDELNAALVKAAADSDLDLASESTLSEKLRGLQSHLRGPVILSMDPFRPMLAATDRHQANWHILRTLTEDRSLDLRWLWVLRTDQLGELPTPAWWEQPAMFAVFAWIASRAKLHAALSWSLPASLTSSGMRRW